MYNNLIFPHVIPLHFELKDAVTMARWAAYSTTAPDGPMLKVLQSGTDNTIPHPEMVPTNAKVIVRHYPMSELMDWVTPGRDTEKTGYRGLFDADYAKMRAKKHAAMSIEIARWLVARGIPLDRQAHEGINEPNLWSSEPPELVAVYEIQRLADLHAAGVPAVVVNAGVGWPGNGNVKDAPPIWSWFKPVLAAMGPKDYLGLHEYWSYAGPGENWKWWAGRFLQCPFNVPILITECGIDAQVANIGKGGWLQLPQSSLVDKAKVFVDQLMWYQEQCLKDGRVKGCFGFSYDGNGEDWSLYNWRYDDLTNALFDRLSRSANLPVGKFAGSAPVPITPPVVVSPPVAPPPTEQHLMECHLARPLNIKLYPAVSQWFGANPANYTRFGLAGHDGIDYPAPNGAPILAAHAGTVEVVGSDADGYGDYVRLGNADFVTIYGHMSKTSVTKGQVVAQGTKLGEVGTTGNSTGPHLHFGLKFKNGTNPAYLGWVDMVPFRDV